MCQVSNNNSGRNVRHAVRSVSDLVILFRTHSHTRVHIVETETDIHAPRSKKRFTK